MKIKSINQQNEKKIEVLPDLESFELDDAIDWLRQNENLISEALKPDFIDIQTYIYDDKIASLKNSIDLVSPDEILAWIKHHQTFINPAQEYRLNELKSLIEDQLPSFHFSKKLEALSTETQVVEQFQREIATANIDKLLGFIKWYEKHQPFSEESPKIVENLKKQSEYLILKKIQAELEQEKEKLLAEKPHLEKYLLDSFILGKGNSGIIIENKKLNQVIKIFNRENSRAIKEEVENHEAFINYVLNGYDNHQVPQWLKIPSILCDPRQMPDQIYSIEKIDGVTLKRLAFLKVSTLKVRLGPFSEEKIHKLSEIAFEKLLEKRGISFMAVGCW